MQNLMIEELENVVAPGDIADFITGVGTGIAIGMLICGGA
jgi:hypothetical protein